MIKFENLQIVGWEPTIRGMRNPMNSWDKSDSGVGCDKEGTICRLCEHNNDRWPGDCYDHFRIGPNDRKLMMQLAKGGSDHAKYRRMIIVYVDIIAPLYWWKEFDTYKVGTVANSCSTMHKIHAKEFTLDDFSHEHLIVNNPVPCKLFSPLQALGVQIDILNKYREMYLESGDKEYWWQMIQLLPSSYNQRRTIEFNYEVLSNMYSSRKNHKLDEWRELCKWIEGLPCSEIITGVEKR